VKGIDCGYERYEIVSLLSVLGRTEKEKGSRET